MSLTHLIFSQETKLLTIRCIEIAFGHHGIKFVKCSQEHFISIISSFLNQNKSKDSALDATLFRSKLLLERLFLQSIILTELIIQTLTQAGPNQTALTITSVSIVPIHRISNKIITISKCQCKYRSNICNQPCTTSSSETSQDIHKDRCNFIFII